MADTRSLVVLVVVVSVGIAGCVGGSPADAADSTAGSSVGTAAGTASTPNGTLTVHFINVGQSVSTLVVGPTGETMLVDTGDFTDDGRHVLAYLRQHGVSRIDYLVVSHNDADHIGGNAAVIEYFETEAEGVGAVYDPGIAASTETYSEYLDAVESYNVTLYETREGDPIPFEGVDVDVLGPPEPYIENEARNENSVVLELSFGRTSFLFPGDAEDDQESYLVENHCGALDATVLKAGHHGSKTSSTGPFLDAVAPKAVVVSSAYDSRYGHPHEETLRRFAERSLPTYWTGTHGDIVLVSNGSHVTVKTQQDAPTDPLSLREGNRTDPGATEPVRQRATIRGEQAATSTVSENGTRTAGGDATPALTVERIHADAAGDDRENLNDEYVVFGNSGDETLDISGWTVRDEAGRTYTVPDGTTLAPGATLTLHTGSGTDTASDLYWDAGSPVWNNDGDTVRVTKRGCQEILTETYP